MQPTRSVQLGDAVSAAIIDSVKAWRTFYAPTTPYEGLLGGEIEELKTTVTQRGYGQARIHVVVKARRHSQRDQHFYVAKWTSGELHLESLYS